MNTRVVQEIAEAYGILGNPDKRALYDDFGHDHAGFESSWEYDQSRTKASSDFYNGDNMIHKLTEAVCVM